MEMELCWEGKRKNCVDFTKQNVEKKLKLFGFDLNQYHQHDDNECVKPPAEDTTCCSISNIKSDIIKTKANMQGDYKKKLECQYCYKEYANSQALGGHQNAHKKERLKKKKMQLQAKKIATINCYLQEVPFKNSIVHAAPSNWYYDDQSRLVSLNPFQHNMFTLTTHSSTADYQSKLPILIKPSPKTPVFKHSFRSLDLQLGLS